MCMSVDRFLDILLNIKYEIYCTLPRVKLLLFSIWFTGFSAFVVLVLIRKVRMKIIKVLSEKE